VIERFEAYSYILTVYHDLRP